jgi:SsrA-binding protein
MDVIAVNKKARRDYFIEETFEAGIMLKGSEIKSVRNKKVNIEDAYILIKDKEAFIINMHISKYEYANIFNHEETRRRKLLLHKTEIVKIETKKKLQQVTIIPLKIYIKDGLAKMEICIAKGKKLHDKRHDLATKDSNLRLQKIQKRVNRAG